MSNSNSQSEFTPVTCTDDCMSCKRKAVVGLMLFAANGAGVATPVSFTCNSCREEAARDSEARRAFELESEDVEPF